MNGLIIIKRALARDENEISRVSRDNLIVLGPSIQIWAFKVLL
jgi:hypothetical protein